MRKFSYQMRKFLKNDVRKRSKSFENCRIRLRTDKNFWEIFEFLCTFLHPLAHLIEILIADSAVAQGYGGQVDGQVGGQAPAQKVTTDFADYVD